MEGDYIISENGGNFVKEAWKETEKGGNYEDKRTTIKDS